MTILRTDEQADALEILKLVIETADFYRAMAESLTEDHFDGKFVEIAKERETFIEPFKKVAEQLHELPARPDPEKELLQELGGKLTKLFSSDSTSAILEKCIKKDEELAELVNNTVLGEQSIQLKTLLDSLSANLANTKKTLLILKINS